MSAEMDRTTPSKRVKRGDQDGSNPGQSDGETQHEVKVIPQFPEEILEIIFSHLKTTKEVHPVSNACPTFNRILDPTKPVWSFDQTFPLIFSELDKKDILNCRLVCKQWRDIVDRFVEDLPRDRNALLYPEATNREHNRPLYSPQFSPTLVHKGLSIPRMATSTLLTNQLELMWSHPRNPLILRSVHLSYFLQNNTQNAFTRAMRAFLCTLGQEIWHINLEARQSGSLILSYQTLRQILSYLPNLRTLRITGFSIFRYISSQDLLEVAVLKQFISQSSLPNLPYLQRLKLGLYNPFKDGPVKDELMQRYSSHVKNFSGCLSYWDGNFLEPQMRSLTSVTDIQLHCTRNLVTWNCFCYYVDAPNLRKLTLQVGNEWEVTELLRPLSNMPSLRYLNLRFQHKSENFAQVFTPDFVLKNIKTLEIMDSSKVQYDHLLTHLPDLEYLLVCQLQTLFMPNISFEDIEQWEIFQWIEGPSIYQSNLWTRLNALKEVTLARVGDNEVGRPFNQTEIMDWMTFTRETYNQLQGIEE